MKKFSFQIDGTLKSKRTDGRLNTFVLVPGIPRFPSKHSGLDDAIDPEKEMDIDHMEYLKLGESTIDTLFKVGGKDGKPLKTICPRVIFFNIPNEDESEALDSLYQPHSLASYKAQIAAERQLPLDIHIAAHADPKKIGSITLDFRVEIEHFAELFDQWFTNNLGSDLAAILKAQRLINFTFHACNSALVPIGDNMSDADIAALIKDHSLIGKFATIMLENGYKNITITGFRGFYCHAQNHRASYVSTSPQAGSSSFLAEKAMFTINGTTGHVSIPPKKNFPVELPGYPSRPPVQAEIGFFAQKSEDDAASSAESELTVGAVAAAAATSYGINGARA